jgi:protein-disulfide isomerase
MATSNTKKIGAGFLLVLAVVWVFVLVKGKPSRETANAEDSFMIAAANPELRNRLSKEAGRPRKGVAAPRILIVEFSDLQCSGCKSVQPLLDRLLKDNPDAALVFKQFPLDVHPWARKAAAYAECVAVNNSPLFWSFIKEVYAHQDAITLSNSESQLRSLLKSQGGDDETVARCAGDQEVQHQIESSIKFGREIGVTGTPGIFVNGRHVYNLSPANYALLNKVIQQEILPEAMNLSK